MFNRLTSLALAGVLSLGLISQAPAAQGTGCLPTTGTVSGLSLVQAINSAVAALISGNSGASPPQTDCTAAPVKGQIWLDTSVSPNVEKRYDGTNWVVVGALDTTNHVWAPPIGGGTTSITAASITDICAAASAVQTITGTTAITSFGANCVVGVRKTLLFNSAAPIIYNATSMALPAQRDFSAVAGDVLEVLHRGSGNWLAVNITKADGSSITNPAVPLGTISYGMFGTIPPKSVIGSHQALARSLYPDYFAAVTRVQSGTLTSGNNTITGLSNTRGFGAGMPIEGTGIPPGTTIVSVTSSTIAMSGSATTPGSQSVRVFLTGYGSGGDSTTVGVPNCVGQTLAGLDPSATQLDGAGAMNSFQGVKSVTLTVAQVPPLTFSGMTGTNDVGHNHRELKPGGSGVSAPGGPSPSNVEGADTEGESNPHKHPFGGVTNGGNGAHPNVQPTRIAECVVVVLP